MKKKPILLLLILSVGVFSFVAIPKIVSAARGTGAGCNADDIALFPYGFICGSAPVNNGPAPGGNNSGFMNSIMPADGTAFLTGSTIPVRGHYTIKNPTGQEVLVWVTIDGPSQLTQSGFGNQILNIGNVNGVGGQPASCPGAGAPTFGPVYNYRNWPGGSGVSYTNNSTANGNAASPVAFVWGGGPSQDLGNENCKTDGRMVYWTGQPNSSAGEVTGYNFDYKLGQGRTGEPLCITINVSLRLGKDGASGNYFPTPAGYAPHQQHKVSSNVAAQERRCYSVYNTAPTGTFGIDSCTAFHARVNDLDHDGQPTPIRLKYSNGIAPDPDVTPTYWSNNIGTNHSYSSFVPTRPYTLQIRDIDIPPGLPGDWVDKTVDSIPPGCVKPPEPPQFTPAVRCDGVVIQNLYDPQDTGPGVMMFAQFYHRQWDGVTESWVEVNGPGWDWWVDDVKDGTVIPWPEGLEQWWQQGWGMHIGAYDVVGPGGADDPASAKWYYSAEAEGVCYQATCSVSINGNVPGGAPSSAVRAGQPFSANITISNPPNQVPVSAYIAPSHPYWGNGVSWQLAGQANTPTNPLWGAHPAGNILTTTGATVDDFQESGPIWWNTSQTYTKAYNAPAGIGNYNISMYPDYWGLRALGPWCGADYQTYQPFNITPLASGMIFDPDVEGATSLTFNSSASNSGSTASINVTRNVTKNVPAPAQAPTYGSRSQVYSLGSDATPLTLPVTRNAGDKYCGYINVSPAAGWVGPGGAQYTTTPTATSGPICEIIVDRPYVRAYGQDVMAGGGYSAPATGNGIIRGFTRDQTQGAGSGAEFGALALQQVDGFTSASLRDILAPNPKAPKGLTFANFGVPGFGGNFAGPGGTRKATDFYNEWRKPETPRTTISSENATSLANNEQSWTRPSGGVLKIKAGAVYDRRHAIFVDGDVYIEDDVAYRTNWSGINQIPSFAVIAKGNIYIDKDVGQIDGIFVAQPNGGTGGKIYTCVKDGGVPYSQSEADAVLHTQCNKPLRINGIFSAQEVKFLRTFCTLSCIPRAGTTYARERFSDTKAAEAFQLGPEFYLTRPVFRNEGSQSNGKYDYMISLPPIL